MGKVQPQDLFSAWKVRVQIYVHIDVEDGSSELTQEE